MPAPHCRVWIFRTISGSQMSLQLLQKAQIIKQTEVLLWKIWRKSGSDLSRIYLAVLKLELWESKCDLKTKLASLWVSRHSYFIRLIWAENSIRQFEDVITDCAFLCCVFDRNCGTASDSFDQNVAHIVHFELATQA